MGRDRREDALKPGYQLHGRRGRVKEYSTIAAMILVLLGAYAVGSAGHMLAATLLFVAAAIIISR